MELAGRVFANGPGDWCSISGRLIGGARGVMVIVAGIGHGDTSSWTDCISHS